LYDKYKDEGKFPVRLDENDERWLDEEKITLVKARIAGIKEFVRHDHVKLSNVIMEILNEGKHR
jgi:hypothetical protein